MDFGTSIHSLTLCIRECRHCILGLIERLSHTSLIALTVGIFSPFSFLPGKPLPRVLWFLNDQLLDDTYQQTYEGTVKNGLTIRNLNREHTTGHLRCVATNNNITKAVETSVKLRMLCKWIQEKCNPSSIPF